MYVQLFEYPLKHNKVTEQKPICAWTDRQTDRCLTLYNKVFHWTYSKDFKVTGSNGAPMGRHILSALEEGLKALLIGGTFHLGWIRCGS